MASGDAPPGVALVAVAVLDDVGATDDGPAGRSADVDAGGGAVVDVGVGNCSATTIDGDQSSTAQRCNVTRIYVGRSHKVGRRRLDGELASLIERGLDLNGGIAIPNVSTVGVVDTVDVLETESALPNTDDGLVGLLGFENQDGPALGVLGAASIMMEVGILR